MNKAVYDLLNISGDNQIGLIDILQMCAHFGQETSLGNELHQLLGSYTERNVRASLNKGKFKINMDTYLNTFPRPCLVGELNHVLCSQFLDQLPQYVGLVPKITFDYRFEAVTDETGKSASYFEKIAKNRDYYGLDQIHDEFNVTD